MAEHDYVIANDTAPQVRDDVNNALAAIVSNNSKATEPTTTFAYMPWYDTATNILKFRNSANNAWIPAFEFDQTNNTIENITVDNITNTILRMVPYRIENIAFTESSGTVTMHSADGTALSATNPGYVCLPSNATPGQLILHTITANQVMVNTEMNGNIFGTTASVAWGNAMPLYFYLCADDSDTNVKAFWGRIPHMKKSPVNTSIGDPSSATADAEISLYSWDDITETSYDANNCAAFGSIRVTKSSGDVWTFTAMAEGQDGIGLFNDSTKLTFPDGQNGAASGKNMKNNGGTAPGFSARYYTYFISRHGKLHGYINNEGAASNGSGAVDALVALPLQNHDADSRIGLGCADIVYNTSSSGTGVFKATGTRGEAMIGLNNNVLDNGDFTGSKAIDGFFTYNIYDGS